MEFGSCASKIRALPSGIYLTSIHNHVLAYIKLENGQTFLWDPNEGLLGLSAEQALGHINQYHVEWSDQSSLTFFRVEDRKWAPLFYRIKNIPRVYQDLFQTYYHGGRQRMHRMLAVSTNMATSFLIFRNIKRWTGIHSSERWIEKGAKVALGTALKVLTVGAAVIETSFCAMAIIPLVFLKPFLPWHIFDEISFGLVAAPKVACLALQSIVDIHALDPDLALLLERLQPY